MYGNDHLGLIRDLASHVSGIHVDGAGVNVRKYQLAADCERVCHGSHEGDGGNDNLVACLQVGVLVSDLKACGCIGYEGRGVGSEILVASRLSRLNLGSERKLAGRGSQGLKLLYLLPNCLQCRIVLSALTLHQEADDLHQVVHVVVLTYCRPRHLGSTGVVAEIRCLFSHLNGPPVCLFVFFIDILLYYNIWIFQKQEKMGKIYGFFGKNPWRRRGGIQTALALCACKSAAAAESSDDVGIRAAFLLQLFAAAAGIFVKDGKFAREPQSLYPCAQSSLLGI